MFCRVEIFFEDFVTFNFTNNILCLLETLMGCYNFSDSVLALRMCFSFCSNAHFWNNYADEVPETFHFFNKE